MNFRHNIKDMLQFFIGTTLLRLSNTENGQNLNITFEKYTKKKLEFRKLDFLYTMGIGYAYLDTP